MNNKVDEKTMKPTSKRALKPKLRFPEFQYAGQWKSTLLVGVAEVLQGYGFPERYQGQTKGRYPFYKVSDISNSLQNGDYFISKAANYINEDIVKEIRAKLTPAGTTIFARIGEAIRSNRRVVTTSECLIDNNVAGIKKIEGKATDLFVYYLLSRINLADHAGGVVPAVNKSTIENIPIVCPDIPEQQKIADCLSSIDDLITAEAKTLEGETLPKLRFPEFREQWIETQLDNLCSNISSGRDQIDPDGAFDLYGSTSVIGKTRNPSYSGERILVARVGANAGLLTKAKGVFGVTDNTLVVSLNPSTNIDFLFHYLENININRLIFGSGQPLITGYILKTLPILVPADSEQRRISACLSSLDKMIIAQSCKLEAIKTHKKGLMQQLFPSSEEVEA
jgi:type I restriction enzyme S subunit